MRSPWLVALGAGLALGGLIAWRADSDPLGANRLWIAAVIVVFAAVMIGAPARLWWRHDAAMLSRLPIPGGALYDVALVRSLRVTGHAVVVCAPALIAFARVDGAWAVRLAAWLGAIACAAALLVPAAAMVGGAMVALGGSTQMTRTVSRFAGATKATRLAIGPRTARGTEWLGALPGFAMSAIAITALVGVAWLDGRGATAFGPGPVVVAALATVSVALGLAARRAAADVMPAALREVVALDRQQLAHLELHPPTALERAFARLLGARARLVHGKDARLMRRRYPLAFVAGAIGTITLWIVAAARPASIVAWATAIVGAMALYAAALARRLGRPPIELPTTIAALPIAAADVAAAKRVWYASWLAVYAGLGGAAVIARAPDPLTCAGALVIAVGAAALFGVRALAAEDDA